MTTVSLPCFQRFSISFFILDEATPVGAEVEEPPKAVRRTRKKASEDLSKAEPVENFSDDE
jgi:hypothetical protein